MPRLPRCLLRALCLIAMSVLFSATCLAKSSGKPQLTTASCTSKTGLYCEIYGKGDPILFLHGLAGSIYTWRHMVAPLSRRNKVILIDLRGAGKSPKPRDKHYSTVEQGDLIHQFILEHDLKNLTLVGNSLGGAISLLVSIRLVEEKPSRLAKLILIDSAAYPDHLPLLLKILRTPVLGWLAVNLVPVKIQMLVLLRQSYYEPSNVTKAQVKAWAKPIAEPGGRHALLQTGKQAIPKNIQEYIDKYPGISVPTLILWGEGDRMLRRDVAERLDKAIPDSRLIFIKYAGHIPQEEQPAVVVCRIKQFLQANITCPPQSAKGSRKKGK